MNQLAKEAGSGRPKTESYRRQLPNIILEFDLLMTVKNNQDSFTEGDTPEDYKREYQTQRADDRQEIQK